MRARRATGWTRYGLSRGRCIECSLRKAHGRCHEGTCSSGRPARTRELVASVAEQFLWTACTSTAVNCPSRPHSVLLVLRAQFTQLALQKDVITITTARHRLRKDITLAGTSTYSGTVAAASVVLYDVTPGRTATKIGTASINSVGNWTTLSANSSRLGRPTPARNGRSQ